ncbi:MAG: dockerin type I repeat-containing protein [Candidatus Sumerlaeota bacterium]|nr:dockerin type I repeat-containing protein [Candidatus Sumerlaeota bacterium]
MKKREAEDRQQKTESCRRPGVLLHCCSCMLMLLSALGLSGNFAYAAVHYVCPDAAGSQDGTDWVNAWKDLPADLTRGDTYYLAGSDISYASHDFGDVETGTTPIIIKKATASDHGTDVGWNAGYGTKIAQWNTAGWFFRTGYYTIDGQIGSGSNPGSYGIRMQYLQSGSSVLFSFIGLGHGPGDIDGLTLRHIEIDGVNSQSIPDTTAGTNGIFTYSEDNYNRAYLIKNCVMQYLYLHDISGAPFNIGSGENMLLESSIIARNRSTSGYHGVGFIGNGNLNGLIMRYNLWEDIDGTAVIEIGAGSNKNWEFYGNILSATKPIWYGSGVVVVNKGLLDGLKFFNNSICGLQSGTNYGISAIVTGVLTNADVRNNLWWNTGAVALPQGSMGSHDYNTFLNTPLLYLWGETTASANEVVNMSAADPFVDSANKDFHLSSATTPGINLNGPYNLDLDVAVRGLDGVWDRGAYEKSTGAIIYGDVSGDGVVTAYDAALIAQGAVGLISLTPAQIQAADVSGEGQITAYDAALIAQYAVGLITRFPVQEVTYNDGSANAPTGASLQHPTLFDGYATRPPWKVAGVDYGVGIPTGTVLKDPTAPGILPSGASLDTVNHLIRVTGNNCTLDGFDFSLHNYSIYITGAANARIINSKFVGGVPIMADAAASNTYIGYNDIDGGGVNGALDFGELLYLLGPGGTIEYNWIRNAPQHFLSACGGGIIIYRFNVLEEGGWGIGAHLNYLQFGGGSYPNPQIVFNTMIQHPSLAGGEGFQLYTNGTGSITNGEIGNNTMLAVPNGDRLAESYLMHAGSNDQYPSAVSGTVHDNYMDASGSYGAFYPGLSGVSYANNIDLRTGDVLQ